MCVLFCLATSLPAQDSDDSSSRIERLYGGVIGMNLDYSGEMFSAGLGSRADAMGGSISTLFPDPDMIAANPAGLAFADGLRMTFDWSPPLTINPTIFAIPFGVGNIEDKINNELHDTARNNSADGTVAEGVVQDADLNSSLDMRGGLKGGAVMYGNPYFAVAASFHQPFRLDAQLNISGIEFLAAALDDDGNETQRIFGTVNGNLSSNITIESSSAAISARLTPNLAVGAAYDNLNGEMNFEGTFLPEGIIRSAGGDTRAFNDPARVQYDSLFTNIRGDWEGSARRFRVGVGYHPGRKFSLDATLTMPFEMRLTGPFSMVHNSIRALNLGAEGDEEVFDVDVLVEDNLTKTQKEITEIPGAVLSSAGKVALGFSSHWSNYLASAVYTHYFDEMSYRFAYEQFDSLHVKTEEGTIRQGIRPQNGIRIGIGVEPLILGLGLLTGETFKVTTEDEKDPKISDPDRFFLPFFSLGGGVRLSRHLRFDYVLSLYSSSFLRFSTTYRL